VADIVTIETPELGDRSYLVHDGEVAAVIDPQRDIDRVLAIAEGLRVRITHVAETHLHNDYVTGGAALAEATGAEYLLPAGDDVSFERSPLHDGDEVEVGSMRLRAIHTPGHTPHHLAYALVVDGHEEAVFTGGSMLFGAVGRTDLISEDMTEELTRAQYRSVRRLADELPAEAEVLPTHGFGSFCSATETKGDESTLGRQRDENVALTCEDEDAFVEQLIAGLTAYPRYYVHMGPANALGPAAPDLSHPQAMDPDELRSRIEAGEWVVDLRQRRAFARRHVSGTVSVELGEPFTTYLAWTIPWGTPLTLVGDSRDQVLEARRSLSRVGLEEVAGAAVGGPDDLAPADRIRSYRVATFAELVAEAEERPDEIVVLDVRRPDEWDDSHIAGATHVPFYELEERMDEVPDAEVWVHCVSGFRAAIAASLLDRAGRRTVLIDEAWEQASEAGADIES
jgi:hydroxyacylglutathione hydrolase